jgi:hypothetical protein
MVEMEETAAMGGMESAMRSDLAGPMEETAVKEATVEEVDPVETLPECR